MLGHSLDESFRVANGCTHDCLLDQFPSQARCLEHDMRQGVLKIFGIGLGHDKERPSGAGILDRAEYIEISFLVFQKLNINGPDVMGFVFLG